MRRATVAVVSLLLLGCSCGSDLRPKPADCPSVFTQADACNALWATPGYALDCHACEYGADYCLDTGKGGVWWMRDDGLPVYASATGKFCEGAEACSRLCEQVAATRPAGCFEKADCEGTNNRGVELPPD